MKKYEETNKLDVVVARSDVYAFLASKENRSRAERDGYLVEKWIYPKAERVRLRAAARKLSDKRREEEDLTNADISRKTMHVTDKGMRIFFCMFYLKQEVYYVTPDRYGEIQEDCKE